MKRIVSLILCLMLVVGLFAGCGSSDGVKKGDGSTLNIGLCTKPLIEDYENNGFTKWIEEQSGYKIEFTFYSSNANDAKTQLSTTLAGGDKLPDILWGISLGTDVYTEYGEDGYIIDLAPYYNDKEKSKVFWDRFENEISKQEQDDYLRALTNPETKAMYVFPTIQTSEVDVMDYVLYINKTWLDKLGLAMPKSMDEFYNVLVAFRDKDPNGNGLQDEIPLIGGGNTINGNIVNYLINQFCYFNVKDGKIFSLENGKLGTPFTTDAYREGLKLANKLYAEKLLSSLSLTMGTSELKTMLCPLPDASGNVDPSSILVGAFCGHLTLVVDNDAPAFNNYEPMDYWANCVVNRNLHDYNVFITADCEKPDDAWNFLMTTFTKEASLRMRYGEYGVDWTDADENSESYIGKKAEIKLINNVFAQQNSSIWGGVIGTMCIDAENEATQVEGANEWMTERNKKFGIAQKNFMAAAEKYNPKEICPVLNYTQEEKDKYDMTMSNVKSYISTARSQFVTGAINPNSDSDWQAYLKQLDTLGLQDYLTLAQTSYDRQLKK